MSGFGEYERYGNDGWKENKWVLQSPFNKPSGVMSMKYMEII
jgi:hypothetical protein